MPKGGLRSTSWNKGESGNITRHPKRPEAIEAKKIVADVKAAAREHTQDALDTLKAVMSDAKAPSAARVSAATAMLDRGWSNSDRPCGHSSLVCAVDAQIAVKRDASENIVATLESRGQRHGLFAAGVAAATRALRSATSARARVARRPSAGDRRRGSRSPAQRTREFRRRECARSSR